MALREVTSTLCQRQGRRIYSPVMNLSIAGRRHASIERIPTPSPEEVDLQDLETESAFMAVKPPSEILAQYDPVKRAQTRRQELPPSRYQYRPPRFYRGPLSPHQPPPASDPSSRVFVPGPFYNPRMQQTYQSTVAPDLMALLYKHKPPGTVTPPKAERLRTWDDSSPYHSGRPKRGPKGPSGALRYLEPDINWRNIPKVEAITLHTFTKGTLRDSAYLHVAGMVLQSISGVKAQVHRSKVGVAEWGLSPRIPISLTSRFRGDQALEFMDKLVHLVLPKIRDWPGVPGTSGDSSGNLSFGLDADSTMLFPEIQINYDMYPPKMIPGFHVTIHTTAKSDRHARLLLKAMGLPFYGKLVN